MQEAEASGKLLFGKESPASPLLPFALTPPMPAHVAAADEYFGRVLLSCVYCNMWGDFEQNSSSVGSQPLLRAVDRCKKDLAAFMCVAAWMHRISHCKPTASRP